MTTEYTVRITGFMPYVTTEETTSLHRVNELQREASEKGWGVKVLTREVSEWTAVTIDA